MYAHLENPAMVSISNLLDGDIQYAPIRTSGLASSATPTGTSSSSYFPDFAMLYNSHHEYQSNNVFIHSIPYHHIHGLVNIKHYAIVIHNRYWTDMLFHKHINDLNNGCSRLCYGYVFVCTNLQFMQRLSQRPSFLKLERHTSCE